MKGGLLGEKPSLVVDGEFPLMGTLWRLIRLGGLILWNVDTTDITFAINSLRRCCAFLLPC